MATGVAPPMDTEPAFANRPLARLARLARSSYLWSVGAQGLVSGFHFVLNLVLLRLVTPHDYGIFAFAFVLGMFASAVNNALIATPLTVWTPVIRDPGERTAKEALFGTLNVLLFLALLAVGVGWALVSGTQAPGLDASIGTAVFVAAYAARQYSRSIGYARMKPLVTASGDAAYVLVGAALVGAHFAFAGTPTIGRVLLMLALANGSAMLVERLRLHGGFTRFRLGTLLGYGPIWRETRWALVGSLTTLFLAQAHSLIVTWVAGPGAFAPLAAGFVLFGPVRIALMTWQNMVKPELAVALDEGRVGDVREQLARTTLVTVVAVCGLGLCLWLAWPWIHSALYARRYADAPMGLIVATWAVITLFAASYNAPSAALQALKDFRVLAIASIWGAGLSGLLVGLLLWLTLPEYTLYGVLAAETFMAFYLGRTLILRLARRERADAADALADAGSSRTGST